MANQTTLAPPSPPRTSNAERERIFDLFRRWGYAEATLDPLGFFAPLKFPDLENLSGEYAEEARAIYSGTVGVEFMHLPEPERRRWIADRIEGLQSEVN